MRRKIAAEWKARALRVLLAWTLNGAWAVTSSALFLAIYEHVFYNIKRFATRFRLMERRADGLA